MGKKYIKYGLTVVASMLMTASGLTAAQMEGKIQYLTNKFKTFVLVDTKTGKTEVIRFGKKTPSLKPNDRVRVTFKAGKDGKGVVRAATVTKLYGDGGISPEEFAGYQEAGAFIVDVRREKDAKKGLLAKAVNIPLNDLEKKMGMLPRDKKVVLYCNSGPIAAVGYTLLKNNGFKDVNYLAAKVRFRKGKPSIK